MSGAEIPALPNTLASVMLKYSLFDEYQAAQYGIPQLVSDIYIQDGSAKLVANEEGVMESVLGRLTVTGKDADGVEHTAVFELTSEIYDVNATTVEVPDVTGAEVIESYNSNNYMDRFVGTYQGNVVEQQGGETVKVGECSLSLTRDGDRLVGTFSDGANTYDVWGSMSEEYYGVILHYTVDGQEVLADISDFGNGGEVVQVSTYLTISEDGSSHLFTDDTNTYYMLRSFD
jgi:hypothetical protein